MGSNPKRGRSGSRTEACDFIRSARLKLDKSQSELAALLSLSTKAVQSYEQGWRDVPHRVLRDVMILLALTADSALLQTPCWEIIGCPPETTENCPSCRVSQGRLCWFVACSRGSRAAPETVDQPPLKCLACPVITRFFA